MIGKKHICIMILLLVSCFISGCVHKDTDVTDMEQTTQTIAASLETTEESVTVDHMELFEEEPIPDTEETKVLEATEQIDPENVTSDDNIQKDEVISNQKTTAGNVVGFGGENETGQDEF